MGAPASGPAAAVPFVILSGQRTGSTWLRDLLDGHPAIAAYTELFLEYGNGFPESRYGPTDVEHFESWLRERSPRGSRVARARGAVSYLGELYGPPAKAQAVGFKLMYSQVRRNPTVAAYLAARRVRVIHLVRENLLDVVISQAAAITRAQPHAWGAEQIRDVEISLDPTETIRRLRRLRFQRLAARRFLRACRLPTLDLAYEELKARPDRFEATGRFLGVEGQHTPTTSMRKLNRSPKSELVRNWPELSRALEGTQYAEFLAE